MLLLRISSLLRFAVFSAYLIPEHTSAADNPPASTNGCGFGYELLSSKLETLDLEIVKVGAVANLQLAQSATQLAVNFPRTCNDKSITTSGTYTIQPERGFKEPFPVRCQHDYEGGGWTVIQNRFDGSTNFVRPWEEFKNGFGHLDGEFWLGLEKIHQLTYASPHELHVLLEDFEGAKVVAKYEEFAIASENEFYKIVKLGAYSGTAGDSLAGHKDHYFSTFDRDNDKHETSNCATEYSGAWWHGKCHVSNLNGLYLKGETKSYANGMCWQMFRGYHYSLKVSKMMIRSKV